jgi:hypothetical protein
MSKLSSQNGYEKLVIEDSGYLTFVTMEKDTIKKELNQILSK